MKDGAVVGNVGHFDVEIDTKFLLEKSKSVTAVLGSSVSSHGTYDRSAKAKFLSKGGDPKEFTYLFGHGAS